MRHLLLLLIALLFAATSAFAQFDFPNAPTANQIVTGPNGQTFKWDGTKWIAQFGSGAGAYLPLVGGTLTGPGNLTVNGTTTHVGTVTFPSGSTATTAGFNSVVALGIGTPAPTNATDKLDITAASNMTLTEQLLNTGTGANAAERYTLVNDQNQYLVMQMNNTGFTAGGVSNPANGATITTTAPAGLNVSAVAPIGFWVGAETAYINGNGLHANVLGLGSAAPPTSIFNLLQATSTGNGNANITITNADATDTSADSTYYLGNSSHYAASTLTGTASTDTGLGPDINIIGTNTNNGMVFNLSANSTFYWYLNGLNKYMYLNNSGLKMVNQNISGLGFVDTAASQWYASMTSIGADSINLTAGAFYTNGWISSNAGAQQDISLNNDNTINFFLANSASGVSPPWTKIANFTTTGLVLNQQMNGGFYNLNLQHGGVTASAQPWNGTDELNYGSTVLSLPNGTTLGVTNHSGLLIMTEQQYIGRTCIYSLGGGSTALMNSDPYCGPSNNCSPPANTFGSCYNGSYYTLANNTGYNTSFGVMMIATRNSP